MIDDAEPAVHLAVRSQAPNLVQLEGWSHRFRDIDRYLRAKGYGEEAINYYKVSHRSVQFHLQTKNLHSISTTQLLKMDIRTT